MLRPGAEEQLHLIEKEYERVQKDKAKFNLWVQRSTAATAKVEKNSIPVGGH